MQSLCNYLLTVSDLDKSDAVSIFANTIQVIDDWLVGKGVADPKNPKGSFESLTRDGGGSYAWAQSKSDNAFLTEFHLDELSKAGQIFTTTVSVLHGEQKVIVYIAQFVSNVSVQIAPVRTDARAPKIVRRLLDLGIEWKLNDEILPPSNPVIYSSEDDGVELARAVTSNSRSLPILVVSENEGATIWPRLAEKLAYDLVGLVHVACVNGPASWSLTERLGKRNSCYMGAVRLYWPGINQSDEDFSIRSTVWTASTLLSNDHNGKGLERFRTTLRKLIMPVAAVAVEPPREIYEIKRFVSRKQIQDLEQKVDANNEELAVVKAFFTENQELQSRVEELQKEVRDWSNRALIAEHALNQEQKNNVVEAEDIQPSESIDTSAVREETRFFKKTHSTPSHDVFVTVTNCDHNSWQDASKAEKAKKGLKRLLGSDDWKTLHHCGKCTGGGVWRVRW